MHPVRTGHATMEEAFTILRAWIRHLHIHDGLLSEPLEFRPIGQGDIDHSTAVNLLLGINYNGYLSGEWMIEEPYDEYLPRELAVLKRYQTEIVVNQS